MSHATTIEQVTREGAAGIKISCGCASHGGHGCAAIVTGPAAEAISKLTGAKQRERIHGFVLLANHPAAMMRKANARKGMFPA